MQRCSQFVQLTQPHSEYVFSRNVPVKCRRDTRHGPVGSVTDARRDKLFEVDSPQGFYWIGLDDKTVEWVGKLVSRVELSQTSYERVK